MWKRIVLVALLVAAAVFAWQSNLYEQLEPARLKAWLLGTGVWGPLVFVLVFSGLAGVGSPAFPFLITSVLVWPLWEAFLLNWAGAVGAGIVGYSFARYVGRDWVVAHMPARFAGLDARVGERALATVIFVRLMFFMAAPAHWALGLTRVGLGTFALGTAIGFLPWTILWTVLGGQAFHWLGRQPAEVWALILLAFVALAFLWHRLLTRRGAKS